MNRIAHAQYFATHEHVLKRQQLYQSLPYTHHLADVAATLRMFGVDDEDLEIACWLHDVVEDCPGVSNKHVAEHFGERVAGLVAAVTNEEGPNRKTRHALTYPKIRTTPDAILVKLADRIANVEAGGNLVGMYRKEYADFKHALHGAVVSRPEYLEKVNAMWEELDILLSDRREQPRPDTPQRTDDRRDSDRHPAMTI
jgi:(p)ppGpp synthase/HD superfamily hydrolase